MIQDAKKWNLGVSMLSGFMQHLPSTTDEDTVDQFHRIISVLEEASGEELSIFKISPERLAPRVVSFRPAGYGGGKGSATYSKKKQCDYSYFCSQVHALSNYLPTLRGSSASQKNPYDSLSDDQLMEMLVNRRIKPKRVPGANPEYVYDRDHAIAALLEQDKPKSPAPTHSTVINMHGSNLNYHSPGASITQTADFKSADFRAFITDLKQSLAAQSLSSQDREQVNIDIGTIEVHMNSSRPNPTIISECLNSLKTILENAAGGILASGIFLQLPRYLY